jgi:hypothetical protein
MAKQRRRSCLITLPERMTVQREPVKIWARAGSGKFVCRLEISNAGIAIYGGDLGRTKLGDATWEELVKLLQAKS